MIMRELQVTGSGQATIPAEIRRQLGIEPGDVFRWTVVDDGVLRAKIIRQEYGAFDDFEPVPMGGTGTESHDAADNETDPATTDRE
jgi:AbrB family looped-hinge helix DNA binding protein